MDTYLSSSPGHFRADSSPGTTFNYVTEAPFANTYCHGPFMCTITSTATSTFTYNGGVNFGVDVLGSLRAGISGGFNQAQQTAFARTFQIKLNDNECGYFTFVPVAKDVW